MPKTRTETAQASAFDAGLRLLGQREHSRVDLGEKLAARGFGPAEIAQALNRLQGIDALNEARFAEQLIRMRLRQGYGPARIHSELARRGVAAAIVDVALAKQEMSGDDASWAARAERARRRRFGPDIPNVYAERARQARFLERRGFSAAHISRVLRGAVEPED